MNAKQRRYSERNKKRQLGEYLKIVKVTARLEGKDIMFFYSDRKLLEFFSRGITYEGYPPPPVYWHKKWERC